MEEANIFAVVLFVSNLPPALPASKERECHHFPLTLFSFCIAGTFSPELERGWEVVGPNKTTAEKCGILPIYCSTP
jgi:hypothetical protein